MGDTHIYWPADDPDDRPDGCAVCGTRFDQDKWVEAGVAAGQRGGSAYYDCPTDGCEGTATVLW